MPTTIHTDHANELILVDDVLDPRGGSAVTLGLVNRDGSSSFPGRTLTPDQADELAADLALCAAAARTKAGLAPAAPSGDGAAGDTSRTLKAAVPPRLRHAVAHANPLALKRRIGKAVERAVTGTWKLIPR